MAVIEITLPACDKYMACHRRLPTLEPVTYDCWMQFKITNPTPPTAARHLIMKTTRTCSHRYGRNMRPLNIP